MSPNELSRVLEWRDRSMIKRTSPPSRWTNYQYPGLGDRNEHGVAIGFQDDPSYLGLDDVSVSPAVARHQQLQFVRRQSGCSTANNGLPGVTYYVLTSTNLTLPLSQWTRGGDQCFERKREFRHPPSPTPSIRRRPAVLHSPVAMSLIQTFRKEAKSEKWGQKIESPRLAPNGGRGVFFF